MDRPPHNNSQDVSGGTGNSRMYPPGHGPQVSLPAPSSAANNSNGGTITGNNNGNLNTHNANANVNASIPYRLNRNPHNAVPVQQQQQQQQQAMNQAINGNGNVMQMTNTSNVQQHNHNLVPPNGNGNASVGLISHSQPQPHSGSIGRNPPSSHSQQQQQQQQIRQPPPSVSNVCTQQQQQHSPSWTVPNPLMGGAVGATPSLPMPSRAPTNVPPLQLQQQQFSNRVVNIPTSSLPPPARVPLQQPPQQQLLQPQPQQQQPQPQSQQQPVVQSNTARGARPRVVLSPEARQALAKAIWSAIRSRDGSIAPEAMAQAQATGLPKHAVINAARVAREREAQKRQKQQQQQQQQAPQRQVQQPSLQSRQAPPNSMPHHQVVGTQQRVPQANVTNHLQPHHQQQQQQQPPRHKNRPYQVPLQQHQKMQQAGLPQLPAAAGRTAVLSSTNKRSSATPSTLPSMGSSAYPRPSSNMSSAGGKSATTPSSSAAHNKAAIIANARLQERSRWKRVHSGVFLVQKGRFMALPNSVGTLLRCQKDRVLSSTLKQQSQSSTGTKRNDLLRKAASLQRQQLQWQKSSISSTFVNKNNKSKPGASFAPPFKTTITASTLPSSSTKTTLLSTITLLDPDQHKRFKIQPKREAKALDRMMRKCRAATAETLIKQNKELSKAIVNHQAEFLKYHRLRKAESARLAKSVRDVLNKEDKKKERDSDMAEKARLAALRSNDMQAYSKLLEQTKNERLKFLLDKTDDCISQISSLLQERSVEDKNAAEFAEASNASIGSYYASAHLKMEEVRQPGILVGGSLKEYQVAGLQWMVSLYNNKLNGILADEMGLGKTIQAISLIAYLMEFKENLGPYLVIVPLSTLSNWVNEFEKWCPSARCITYKGTPTQRKELYKDHVRNGQFNVLLTTYEYIIKDKSSLKKITWQYAIVDEGHRMKNAESKFAVTLGTQYTTKNRILLTGTPLQNSLPELWALLNFLLPTIFNSVESFDQWFNRPFASFSNKNNDSAEDADDSNLSNEERMLIIHRLHELLRPFMLRRVKSEVLDQLPEKVEKVLRCELSSWQKELYKQISVKAVEDKSVLGTGSAPTRGLNNIVMQLRKVCNHPYLFSPEGYHINPNMIRCSGKMDLLDRMLPKLKAAGHRVLLFTQMTAVMTILEDYFAYRNYPCLRLDGSTPAEEREKRMYKFNAPDSPYFVFLLSTRAGGLGLNLATADTVIIFDSDWNPMMDLQAQDRAHRIGQRNDVSVFRLITYSPVEEKILARANEKLNMSELVVEAGKFDKSSVENDNSLERRKIMEVLLTDFDSNTPKGDLNSNPPKSNSETPNMSDEDANGDQDDASDTSDTEDFNELIGGNEADYQLYCKVDKEREKNGTIVELYTSPDDIPDWIKYPNGKDNLDEDANVNPDGSRKRKVVTYDDGLTEKQFLRMMEKQADEDEKGCRKRARSPKQLSSDASISTSTHQEEGIIHKSDGGLTDWTFRKLVNITKAVIALKDPTTKRRLCEIFLEKPDPNAYPDYYEKIEKPVAINDILRKCRGKGYTNIEEYRNDWKLILKNALTYNGEGSWVVTDSNALEKELDRLVKKSGFDQQPAPPPKRKPLRIKLSLKKLKDKGHLEESPARVKKSKKNGRNI